MRTASSWAEIYDVLAGEAAFVLQRAEGDPAGDPEVTARNRDRGRTRRPAGHPARLRSCHRQYRRRPRWSSPIWWRPRPTIITRATPPARVARCASWPFPARTTPSTRSGIPPIPRSTKGSKSSRHRDLQPFEAGTPLYTARRRASPARVAFLTNPAASTVVILGSRRTVRVAEVVAHVWSRAHTDRRRYTSACSPRSASQEFFGLRTV